MSLFQTDPIPVVRPGQQNQTGAIDELFIPRFLGIVEGTIKQHARFLEHVSLERVVGTNTVVKKAIGAVDVQRLEVGKAPNGQGVDISRNTLTIDQVILSRHTFPLLETVQNDFNAEKHVGEEQGKAIQKILDQMVAITAIKAAMLTNSPYSNGTAGKPKGFSGGNIVRLGAAGDLLDPAHMQKALADLLVSFRNKDIEPTEEDIVLAARPDVYMTMLQSDLILNSQMKTSDGTNVERNIFKPWGVPIVSSTNVPNSKIENHILSTTKNGNAFDGDFSKVALTAFSPKAILAGAAIPVTSEAWWNKEYKCWFLDTWVSASATPDRAEYAGAILLP